MADSTRSTARPVLIWVSVLAGLQAFLGGATAVSVVAENALVAQIFALSIVAVGAAQFGIKNYLEGKVVPEASVVERVTPHGTVIAGPANTLVREGDTIRGVNQRSPETTALEQEVVSLERRVHEAEAQTLEMKPSMQPFTVDPPEGDHGAAG